MKGPSLQRQFNHLKERLDNKDGTFAVFGCCESFRRADKLIEAMVKTRNKEEETGDDI